jgi:O-antigen ligase
MNKAVVYGFVCVLILLGLIFTQSRTGIALAMLGVFLSAIAFSRRLGGTNVFGVIGTFFAVVIAIAIEIGLAPLVQRFAVDHLENLRFVIFGNTIEGIGMFFPVGSGPGTYPFIYPRFQSIEETAFINHAHNDYLEWIMEGGLMAGLLILACMWFYIRQWPKVWVKGYWSTFQFMQVGAGIGLLLMILHGLTDFNLHIPANAIYFAFLAGVFFYPLNQNAYASGRAHNGVKQNINTTDYDRTNRMISGANIPVDSADEIQTVKNLENPEDIINPFEDQDEKDN